MDDTTLELLSRHLDGDLEASEERALAVRLEGDPSLAARLEALRRLRRSLASLADRETAPAELDNLVDPLLREPAERLVVRPWVRWLGTAAAVVLGITVIVEVNRGGPGPKIGAIADSVDTVRAEPTERFALAPLPTSPLPPEQQPLGASERLLASPIPEFAIDDPRPLDVVGPLEEAPKSPVGDEPDRDKGRRSDEDGAVATAREGLPVPGAAKPAPATQSVERRAGAETKAAEEHEQGRAAGIQPWEVESPRGRAQLFVFINGDSAWCEFLPAAECKPGRYMVRVVVANGAIREARPVGGAASAVPSQRLCAAELIVGLEIEDVSDGEYPAEVVVERRGVATEGLR